MAARTNKDRTTIPPERSTRQPGKKAVAVALLALLLLALAALPGVRALVTDQNVSFSNTTLNDTGAYIGSTKMNERSDDVIVCRSTGVLDHLVKSFQCDYVCGYDDSSCFNEIQSAYGRACTNNLSGVHIKTGTYPLNNRTVRDCNNLHIHGDGIDKTILKIDPAAISNFSANYIIGYTGTTPRTGWEISHMTLDASTYSGTTSSGGNVFLQSYDYLHDLKIRDSSYFGIYGDPVYGAKIERIQFEGYGHADRIGGGNWIGVSVSDITFNNMTKVGTTNIDVLYFKNSTLSKVSVPNASSMAGNVSVFFEPAIDSVIADISGMNTVQVIDDGGYSPSTRTLPLNVWLRDIRANSVTVRGNSPSNAHTEFGNIHLENVVVTGGNSGVLWFAQLQNVSKHVPLGSIKKVYAKISPTAATFNTGSGVFAPCGVCLGSDDGNLTGIVVEDVYVYNTNTTSPAYGVHVGDNIARAMNISVNRVGGFNLTKPIRARNVQGLRTDHKLVDIEETTVTYFRNGGNLTFSGTGAQTVFAIPHKLQATPSSWAVTAQSEVAAATHYVIAGPTSLNVTFSVAPASGTNNLGFSWVAES